MENIKEIVEGDVEKRAAILERMFQGKGLTQVSRAFAYFLPKTWVRLYGWEVDGKVWVNVKMEMDTITITPINKVEALKTMEVNNVEPD